MLCLRELLEDQLRNSVLEDAITAPIVISNTIYLGLIHVRCQGISAGIV